MRFCKSALSGAFKGTAEIDIQDAIADLPVNFSVLGAIRSGTLTF